VEVSPEGVKALWSPEGQRLEEVDSETARELEDYLARRRGGQQKLAAVPTTFRPRAGLGLFVLGGRASFRRVLIQPLPAGRP
jgi:hypothetical protein